MGRKGGEVGWEERETEEEREGQENEEGRKGGREDGHMSRKKRRDIEKMKRGVGKAGTNREKPEEGHEKERKKVGGERREERRG